MYFSLQVTSNTMTAIQADKYAYILCGYGDVNARILSSIEALKSITFTM